MDSSFWDDRYDAEAYAYGTDPNVFLTDAIGTVPAGATVVELGAGEGRNAVWLAQQGYTVTAVDYAWTGLKKTEQLASRFGVDVETVEADVITWRPARTWDALVVTFLHVLPDQRALLFSQMKRLVAPRGWILAEWFRPAQVEQGYESGGPSHADMMVSNAELQKAFREGTFSRLEEVEYMLDEGPHHQGEAATIQMVWQAP